MFRGMVLWLAVAMAGTAALKAQGTRLLRHPAVSRDLVAFEYAGDLWGSGGTAGARGA
jgi:hypothetical protein